MRAGTVLHVPFFSYSMENTLATICVGLTGDLRHAVHSSDMQLAGTLHRAPTPACELQDVWQEAHWSAAKKWYSCC